MSTTWGCLYYENTKEGLNGLIALIALKLDVAALRLICDCILVCSGHCWVHFSSVGKE